jgi:hypothetical protein
MEMNKHEKEAEATEKRVQAGKDDEKKRKAKSLESFRCYLAYMNLREQDR